jgi:hypothetical protein
MSERPAGRVAAAGVDRASVLRFASEIVAWVATPWALAGHSPVLAGVALLLLIGLPAVFATPGDKVKVVVPVPGQVTIGLVVVQLVAAVVSAWAAWPVPVAVLVSALVGATVYTELPRWRHLVGGDLRLTGAPHVANEVAVFVLEALGLAVLAWWGAQTGGGLFVRLLLGIGMPLVAAALWGAVASPRAKAPTARILVAKAVIVGAESVCLGALGHRGLAIAFGVITAASTIAAALDRETVTGGASDPRREDTSSPA